MAHWPKCAISVRQKTPNCFSSLCHLIELSILIECCVYIIFFYRNFPLSQIWLILGKNAYREFPKEDMNGCNISCSCSTLIFQIKQKMKDWTCGLSMQVPPTQISLLFFFFCAVEILTCGFVSCFLLMAVNVNARPVQSDVMQYFCTIQWRENSRITGQLPHPSCNWNQSPFELLSVSVRQQSWFTARLMCLCTTDFPTLQSSQSCQFQFGFREVFLLVIHLGTVISVCFSPLRRNVDSVPQLAQIKCVALLKVCWFIATHDLEMELPCHSM